MKHTIHTIIHAKIVVEAETETKAFTEAEKLALSWMAEHSEVTGKTIAVAREAV